MRVELNLKCPKCDSYDIMEISRLEQELTKRNNKVGIIAHCKNCKTPIRIDFNQSKENILLVEKSNYDIEEFINTEYYESLMKGRLGGLFDVEKWKKLDFEQKLFVIEFLNK